MKRLILLSGPMGVGKSTVASLLYRRLDRSVFLDGDWCWMMHPFSVTEETKAMVLDNITHLLRNFLACTQIDTVIFTWVMDDPAILESILSRLDLAGCCVHSFTLTATPESLRCRVKKDIARGLRQPGDAERSIARLAHYDAVDSIKLDTSDTPPEAVAERLLRQIS